MTEVEIDRITSALLKAVGTFSTAGGTYRMAAGFWHHTAPAADNPGLRQSYAEEGEARAALREVVEEAARG